MGDYDYNDRMNRDFQIILMVIIFLLILAFIAGIWGINEAKENCELVGGESSWGECYKSIDGSYQKGYGKMLNNKYEFIPR